MSEIRSTAPPPRASLLRRLAEELGQIVPGWRCVADEVLAASTRIDLVGVSGAGHAIAVVVGEDDRDLGAIAEALAHRAWLAPRLGDWRKLSPDLGLAPDARAEALVLLPEPGPEARSLAAALPREQLRLARYRFVANGSATGVLIDLVLPAPAPPPDPVGEEAPPRSPTPTPAPFRTGLTDADLGLSDEERSEFD